MSNLVGNKNTGVYLQDYLKGVMEIMSKNIFIVPHGITEVIKYISSSKLDPPNQASVLSRDRM
jgi:hypothetical protein